MRARCLIIGAGGQLGRALAFAFSSTYIVTEAVRGEPNPTQVRMDLGNIPAAVDLLKRLAPDVILIAAAYTNVDRCEQEPLICRRINVGGPFEIAHLARESKSFVVYYSTDHVFNGTEESYTESNSVHPLNVYSRSKVEGETAIRQTIPERHLIIRTSWLYGPDFEERNFPLHLVKRLSRGERVAVAVDQWGSPTFTEDLASTTRFLIERKEIGTFHAAGPDFVSRYDYACRIASLFGFADHQLIPTPTAELKQIAVRPLKVRLNCQKLRSLGLPPLRNIDKGLLELKEWWADHRVTKT